jgi:hypothetical protein
MNRPRPPFRGFLLSLRVRTPPKKNENLFLNLGCNVVLPALVLSKLSTPERLGPLVGLLVALVFPLGYFAWDLIRRRQANFISIIGFISVLLTGGLGLLHLGGQWFAVKDAAIPLVIGLAVLLSVKTKRPLVNTFLYNEQMIDVSRVDAALDERNARSGFARLMATSSYLLCASFFISAALNYGLARYLLKSPPNTPEFNAELAKMHVLNWPVIVLPCMGITMFVLWRLLNGVRALTGLTTEEILHSQTKK